jgi:hypothetical protein
MSIRNFLSSRSERKRVRPGPLSLSAELPRGCARAGGAAADATKVARSSSAVPLIKDPGRCIVIPFC